MTDDEEGDDQDRRNLERAIKRCERAWRKYDAKNLAAAKRKRKEYEERMKQDEQPDRH